MRSKEYVILGIMIVLLGGYLLTRSGDRARYDLPALPDAEGDQISKIEIATGGQTVGLTRSGDRWRIGEKGYPADASKVADILSALQDLTLTALVSEAGAYARYDLTDDTQISVRAWIGDRRVRDLTIGKAADTYQHTFVRIGANPNVYHARDNFRRTFDHTVDDLRDKTVLSFTTGDITGIDIGFGDKQLTLSQEALPTETAADTEGAAEEMSEPAPTVWMNDAGVPADADVVQRLLSQLAYLTCSGYPEDMKERDPGTPILTLTLKGRQTYSLSLFEREVAQTGCPGVSTQNDYPFTLDETACTRLTETIEALLGSETTVD